MTLSDYDRPWNNGEVNEIVILIYNGYCVMALLCTQFIIVHLVRLGYVRDGGLKNWPRSRGWPPDQI